MLFTFPSRYWFTIGLSGVFSLTGWSRLIHAGFLVLRATQDTTTLRLTLRVRGCHPLWHAFQTVPLNFLRTRGPTTPTCRNMSGLGSSPFARHYLGNHCLFSFPAGTKMFQFPALASSKVAGEFLQNAGLSHSEILGSKVICTSPQAYRSLSRPSSPPRA